MMPNMLAFLLIMLESSSFTKKHEKIDFLRKKQKKGFKWAIHFLKKQINQEW